MTIAAPRPTPTERDTATKEPTATGEQLRRVRVWQAPIRVIHWTLVAAIAVLSLTGFAIGNPVVLPGSGGHVMTTVRAVHIGTGLVFVAALLARVWFAFTGNQWARWQQFLPVWRERRRLILPSIRYYLFLEREAPPVVGHNPLAAMTYLLLYAILALQALTGTALMTAEHRGRGWEWALTGWMFPLVPLPTIRLVHHLVMWLIAGFVINHLYSAMLVDREERGGEISSIVSGWKVLPRDRVDTEIRQWEARRARKR
jgi:Ni/Fe-hydrogenase 1 B-type cytochrome subunit